MFCWSSVLLPIRWPMPRVPWQSAVAVLCMFCLWSFKINNNIYLMFLTTGQLWINVYVDLMPCLFLKKKYRHKFTHSHSKTLVHLQLFTKSSTFHLYANTCLFSFAFAASWSLFIVSTACTPLPASAPASSVSCISGMLKLHSIRALTRYIMWRYQSSLPSVVSTTRW